MRRWILSVLWVYSALITALSGQILVGDVRVIDTRELKISHPEGITFHPRRGTIFINTRRNLYELDRDARVLSKNSLTALTERAEAITYDPVTQDLLLCDRSPNIYRIRPDGTAVENPVLVTVPGTVDLFGVSVDPATGNVWVSEDDTSRIIEVDRQGKLVSSFRSDSILGRFDEPQGLDFYKGQLLVADDRQGTSSIYLVTKNGSLVQFVVNISDYGFRDPEGAVIVGNELWVTCEEDEKLLIFKIEPAVVPQNSLLIPNTLPGLAKKSFVGVGALNMVKLTNPMQTRLLEASGRQHSLTTSFPAVPSYSQVSFLTEQILGFNKSQVMILRGERGPIQGFISAGDFDQKRLDAVGSPLQPGKTFYVPRLPESQSEQGSLFVFNPLDFQVEFWIEVIGVEGNLLLQSRKNLGSQASLLVSTAELWPGYTPPAGSYLRIRSSASVQAMLAVLRKDSLVTLGAQAGVKSSRFLVPHFFTRNALNTTWIRLVNPNSHPVRGLLTAFDDSGAPLGEAELVIEPGAMLARDLRLLLGFSDKELVHGYFQITLNSEDRLVTAVEYLTQNGTNSSTLPMQPRGRTRTLFAHVAHSLNEGFYHGLAIVNLEPITATVTVKVHNQRGSTLHEAQVKLAPGERALGLLGDPQFMGPSLSQLGGYLRVDSDRPVFSYTLFGGAEFLSAIEGQSATN